MSAPDTNVDKQVKRHKPSLQGIAAALFLALAALVVITAWDGIPRPEQAAGASTVAETPEN